MIPHVFSLSAVEAPCGWLASVRHALRCGINLATYLLVLNLLHMIQNAVSRCNERISRCFWSSGFSPLLQLALVPNVPVLQLGYCWN